MGQVLALQTQRTQQQSRVPVYTETEQELLQLIQERTNDAVLWGSKYAVSRRALLDLAYFNGHQYTYLDAQGEMRTIMPSPGKPRVKDNMIFPAVQRAMSKIAGQMGFQVTPKDTDFRSQAEAQNLDRMLWGEYQRLRWQVKLTHAHKFQVSTGCGFVRPYFNPNGGPLRRFYIDPASNEVIPPEFLDARFREILERENQVKEVREGEIDLAVHSLFEVHVPEEASDYDLPYYTITWRKSLNYIRNRWPERGRFVAPEQFNDTERFAFENRIRAMASHQGEWASTPDSPHAASAVLRLYVEAPSPDNPKGTYAIAANGILLEHGPSPQYQFGLNGPDLVKFSMFHRPGSYWPVGLVENMIPVQRELNRERNQMSRLRERVLKRRTYIPRGAGLSAINIGNLEGEVVAIDAEALQQMKPELTGDVPAALFAMDGLARQSIHELASTPDASRGENPAGSRSGYMINLLEEQSSTFYDEALDNTAEAYSVLWTHVAQMFFKTWVMPRQVTVRQRPASGGRSEVVWSGKLSNADIASDLSVQVEPADLRMRSRAARQAFITDLMQYGPNFLGLPPMLQAEILEGLEIGDDSGVKNIFLAERRRARRLLNDIIEQGVEPILRPSIDNPAVIMEEILKFQLDYAHDLLPPETQMAIERWKLGLNAMMVEEGKLASGAAGGGETEGGSGETEPPSGDGPEGDQPEPTESETP